MSISSDLRQAVLQAAIQGKLTKQLPEDGNAKDLLEQIKAEKAKLIKEGKLKKEKPLPEITDDEKPFDIPESWVWVRVSDVALLNPKNYLKDELSVAFIPMACVTDGFRNKHTFEIRNWGEIKKGFSHFANGDVGVAKITPCFQNRKSVVFKDLKNNYGAGTTELVVVRPIVSKLLSEYLLWFFKTENFISDGMKSFTGTAGQQRIHKDYLPNCVLPLPPLSEQKRIVAKVEELMAKIDDLEKTEKELEALKKAFPADMKAALLQAAMQGKLTEQLPEDGNAKDLLEQIKAEKAKLVKEGKLKKEKPLPEITEDEIPFDIPENWEWCRIGDLFLHSSGKQQSSNNKSGGTPQKFITTSNLYWGRFVLDNVKVMDFTDVEIKSCSATKGDLLVCEGGAGYGRSAIWNENYDICLQNHIHRLRPCAVSVCEYVYYCIYFLKENNKLAPVGTAMPGLSANRLKGLLIPIPPLAEQKRIVEKLEKLLPLCDGLK